MWGCSDAAAPSTGPDARQPGPERDQGLITPTRDAAVPDGGALGGFMAPCEDNIDCESGWCVEAGARRLCTVLCLDEGCPDDWSCRVVQNTGADAVSICFPPEGPVDHALCTPCSSDEGCPNGACYTLGGSEVCGLDCTSDAGCPEDYECRDVLDEGSSQCVPRRLACPELPDAEVPDAQLADAGVMDAEVPDAGLPDAEMPDSAVPDAELPDVEVPDAEIPDAEVPDAEVPDAETPDAEVPDAEVPDAEVPDMEIPDAAPPRLGYGEPCDAAAQCESELCVDDPDRAGGVCTQLCASADDCPGIDVCLNAEGGQGVCFRNETGVPCVDAGGCVEGLCLTPPDPNVPWMTIQAVCASRCENDRRCPAGFSCEVIQSDQGPVRACAPDVRRMVQCQGGFRDFCLGSGLCQVPVNRDPLDVYLCINVPNALGQGQNGYCSCTCASAADCPDGYGCFFAPELSGDAGRPGICMAASGYRCAAQAAELIGDQCPTLTCVEPGDDPDEAYCSLFCRNDLDCPSGYSCEQEQGSQICVPEPPPEP
ncbi:MAG: hypothetical protein ACE366_10340 [Bradymonadia bacterium]